MVELYLPGRVVSHALAYARCIHTQALAGYRPTTVIFMSLDMIAHPLVFCCSCHSMEHVGKSPADSLTYSLTSNLLTIAGKRPTVRQKVLDSIWSYLDKLASYLNSDNGTSSSCISKLYCQAATPRI